MINPYKSYKLQCNYNAYVKEFIVFKSLEHPLRKKVSSNYKHI